ncbi:ABC transporter ATP-binding protein [Fusibacter sp. JL298sf-3]
MYSTVINYFRLLKLSFKWAPTWVVFTLLQYVLGAVNIVLSSVYVVQLVYQGIIGEIVIEEVYLGVAIVGLLALCLGFVNSLYYARVDPIAKQKIKSGLICLISEKSTKVDLKEYASSDFMHLHFLVQDKFYNTLISSTVYFAFYVSNIVAIALCVIFAVTIDLKIIAFSMLVVPLLLKLNLYKKDILLQKEKKVISYKRKIDYINSLFLSKSHAEEIRIFDIKNYFDGELDENYSLLTKIITKAQKRIYVLTAISEGALEVIIYFGVLFYVILNISNGLADVSTLIPSTAIVYQLVTRMSSLVNVLPTMKEFSFYSDYFYDYMNFESVVENREGIKIDKPFEKLVLNNLSFKYPGEEKFVLNKIDMDIKCGDKIAIVGENGAGKTTLTKIILGLYNNYSGSVFLNDIDVDRLEISSYRDMYSVVLQDFNHFACSISENIKMGFEEENSDFQISKSLEVAGLRSKVEKMDAGLDTIVTKEFSDQGIELSKGQYQRMAIARAFYKNRDIIIMDEPTSALDPHSEYELYDRFMKENTNKTVIIISHKLFTIKNADRIYFLKAGKITEFGNHEELMQLDGNYSKMYKAQMSKYEETINEELQYNFHES